MSDHIIRLHNVSKSYKSSHLGRSKVSRGVSQLSLEVRPGEVFGLLGLNGSGKTTTIKLTLGLLRPDQGDVEVLGHRVPNALAQKKVGYLPEVPYFYRNLSPVEVLDLYGSLSGLSGKLLKARIEEVIVQVGLEKARNKAMREFSKGMLQRVGLAQSILHDPELMILDEPVTGLDPLGIRQTRQLMADLNKKGKTIFISSHSISELERLAHRVAVIHEGGMVRLLESAEWSAKAGRLEELFIQTLEAQGMVFAQP